MCQRRHRSVRLRAKNGKSKFYGLEDSDHLTDVTNDRCEQSGCRNVRRRRHPLILPGMEDEILDTEDLYDAVYGQVDLFVDAGYCPLEPTTLLDLTEDQPRVLRMGQGVIDF